MFKEFGQGYNTARPEKMIVLFSLYFFLGSVWEIKVAKSTFISFHKDF